ncbi:MAG: nitrite reductase large subunit, partial [Acidimicrobiaceae bacterium]|nr:nitrite reductase large subunit [Acidimicrobiaceae bacterium]
MTEEIFVVINEPDKSPRRIVLEGVLEIGRESDGEMVDDTEVSRHHLKLLPSPNGLKVVDLGSSNGTRVNGVLISEPTAVKPGDVIRLGRTEVMVGSPPPAPPPPTTAALAASPAAPRQATTTVPIEPEAATVAPPAPAAPTGRRAPRHPGAAAERPAAATVADVKP